MSRVSERTSERAVWSERLGRSPAFAGLEAAEREALVANATREKLRRGQRLFARGERKDVVALVLTGRLEVVRANEGAPPLVVRTLGPDAIVGLTLVAGAVATADVIAREVTTLLVVPGSTLRRAIARKPEALLAALAHLSDLLDSLTDELASRDRPLRERVARALLREGRGLREIALTHADLAARVGATRAKVSHALEDLARAGAIRLRRGRIEIVDAQRVYARYTPVPRVQIRSRSRSETRD
jgi:CRP/FNR family transcriptional regulator